MRAERLWKEKIPELNEASRVFRLNSPQNAVLSPRNCPGFNEVEAAIANHCHGKTIIGRNNDAAGSV
jgi:hypothetical protein